MLGINYKWRKVGVGRTKTTNKQTTQSMCSINPTNWSNRSISRTISEMGLPSMLYPPDALIQWMLWKKSPRRLRLLCQFATELNFSESHLKRLSKYKTNGRGLLAASSRSLAAPTTRQLHRFPSLPLTLWLFQDLWQIKMISKSVERNLSPLLLSPHLWKFNGAN